VYDKFSDILHALSLVEPKRAEASEREIINISDSDEEMAEPVKVEKGFEQKSKEHKKVRR